MKFRIVYEAINGHQYTKNQAIEYFGTRFEKMINNNLLFKIKVNCDGNEVN